MGRLIVLVLILGLGADVFAGEVSGGERVERSRELSQQLQQQLGG